MGVCSTCRQTKTLIYYQIINGEDLDATSAPRPSREIIFLRLRSGLIMLETRTLATYRQESYKIYEMGGCTANVQWACHTSPLHGISTMTTLVGRKGANTTSLKYVLATLPISQGVQQGKEMSLLMNGQKDENKPRKQDIENAKVRTILQFNPVT